MNIIWLKRLLVGLGCALFFGSITAMVTQAQTIPEEIPSEDCHSCHEAINIAWEDSSHSRALADCDSLPDQEEEEQQKECMASKSLASHNGETAENVSCQVCHPTEPEEHPQKVMYTDTSSRLCGDCHIETFDQISDSVHSQEGMACIRCHNPHDNELRAGGIEDTCRSCHRDEVHFYTFTDHAEEGLLCTDCHMQITSEDAGNGLPQHTFTVGMETCTACHLEELHYPMSNTDPSASIDPKIVQAGFMSPTGDLDAEQLDGEPMASSAINFVVLAAIIGMLFGLIGSPWLEKYYRRHDGEDK